MLRVEAELGRPNCISWLLSDNGAVYKSGAMNTFCASQGIQQKFSAPYSQWMDHTAERNMRTIGEMAVTTLIHANLPKSAWGYAVMQAVEVINRTADSAEINKAAGVSPNFSRLEKWKGHELPGQTKGLYPFGCLAFKHVPGALRTKLDSHATPTVYLGLDSKTRSFLLGSLYDLEPSSSVEVTFIENVFPFRKIKHREAPASLLWGTENNMSEGDPRLGMFESADSSGMSKVLDRQALKSLGVLPDHEAGVDLDDIKVQRDEVPAAPPSSPTAPRRSTRASQPPAALKVYDQVPWQDYPTQAASTDSQATDPATLLIALTESQLDIITPKSAEHALKFKSRSQWLAAMNREKQCHIKNGTFGEEWTQQGPCPKPIPAGWVFKIKHRGKKLS